MPKLYSIDTANKKLGQSGHSLSDLDPDQKKEGNMNCTCHNCDLTGRMKQMEGVKEDEKWQVAGALFEQICRWRQS